MRRVDRFVVLLPMMVIACILAGCSERSISNSGYPGAHAGDPFYHGELSELDVLGIVPDAAVSDAEIARRLATHKRVSLAKGSNVMLIQSGAAIPDDGMVRALGTSFVVTPFSGVPPTGNGGPASHRVRDGAYTRTLRLAAARSGSPVILCYWGVIEAATVGEATKAVSWVPIVGSIVPDETQHMRIRLKVAVIDVATGDWAMFAPAAFTDAALSAAFNRAGADQEQVALVKDKAYQQAADDLTKLYAP